MTRTQDTLSSPRLSDEELEYYGDLFVRCGIREAGVDFESFLTNPEYYLCKHAKGPWRLGRQRHERRGLLRYLWFRRSMPALPD
jgi:hypothetical protein